MTYVDGFVLAVPTAKLDAYFEMARAACKIWMDLGALEYKECVAEDVMDDRDFAPPSPPVLGPRATKPWCSLMLSINRGSIVMK